MNFLNIKAGETVEIGTRRHIVFGDMFFRRIAPQCVTVLGF